MSTIRHLEFPTVLKAIPGEAPGTFEALVAVFGNVDRVGDVIEKGAFTESLKAGLPPVIFAHQWMNPPIGVTLSARETDAGLVVKGRLFVDKGEDSPLARQVYTAMKAVGGDGRPALREFSVGMNVKSERYEDQNGRNITILEAVDLIEFGPCLKGVNTETRLISMKAMETELAEAVGKVTELETETSSDDSTDEDTTRPDGAITITDEQRRRLIDALSS